MRRKRISHQKFIGNDFTIKMRRKMNFTLKIHEL